MIDELEKKVPRLVSGRMDERTKEFKEYKKEVDNIHKPYKLEI